MSTVLTFSQLCELARGAGFGGEDVEIAAAVALAESSGNPDAVGDVDLQDAKWGPSIGLFQIRSLRRPQDFGFPDNLRVESALSSPTYNAKTAKAIHAEAGGFGPWSTFTGGAYKAHLPDHHDPDPVTGSAVRRCLDLLMAEEGYREGSDNHTKYAQEMIDAGKAPAWWQNSEWCYIFQSWGTWKAGLESYCLLSAFCPDGVNYYKHPDRKWWSEYPMVGAEVFYGTAGERWGAGGSHIERVYKFNSDNIWTVGGNTNTTGSSQGNGVYLRGPIPRRDVRVYGYGCPPFPEGRISADPRWGGRATGTYLDLPAPTGGTTPGTPDPRPWVYAGQLEHAIAADVPAPTGHRSYSWPQVLLVEQALVGEGLLTPAFADGSWGTLTLEAYAKWQQRCGVTGPGATGHPDLTTLGKLADLHGFRAGA
ncbi:hypothetical protein [Kitasatospora sp. NPDC004289]